MDEALVAKPTGGVLRVYQYKPKKKSKKQSRYLKGAGKLARRLGKAGQAFSNKYLEKHERSNRKKRDGWARDMGGNLLKADRAALKKVKLHKVIGF